MALPSWPELEVQYVHQPLIEELFDFSGGSPVSSSFYVD